MNPMDPFAWLFVSTEGPFGPHSWLNDLFTLMFSILSWDIVKGGLAFTLAVGIALFAVQKIRQGFGV